MQGLQATPKESQLFSELASRPKLLVRQCIASNNEEELSLHNYPTSFFVIQGFCIRHTEKIDHMIRSCPDINCEPKKIALYTHSF